MCEIGKIKQTNEQDNQRKNVELPKTEGTPWIAPEIPELEPEAEPIPVLVPAS